MRIDLKCIFKMERKVDTLIEGVVACTSLDCGSAMDGAQEQFHSSSVRFI
jgi:hypothetical protein